MFTPQQYRAKAAEYAELVKTASNTDEEREFRKLETSFLALASNTQWVADNQDKILYPAVVDAVRRRSTGRDAEAIATWNNEGGAQVQMQHVREQRQSMWTATREQTDS